MSYKGITRAVSLAEYADVYCLTSQLITLSSVLSDDTTVRSGDTLVQLLGEIEETGRMWQECRVAWLERLARVVTKRQAEHERLDHAVAAAGPDFERLLVAVALEGKEP